MNPHRFSFARRLQLLLLSVFLLGSPAAQSALRVDLSGVEGELKDNILALLTVQRERETTGLSEGHVRRYFQRGEKEIRQALEPFGYYSVQVESRLEQSGDDWIAHFVVLPGEPLRFATVEMRLLGAGAKDATLRKLIETSELKPGVIARHSLYEAAKSRLQKQAFENGYLEAHFLRHELRIDSVAQTAAAILELDTGPQFYFGEIIIKKANTKLFHPFAGCSRNVKSLINVLPTGWDQQLASQSIKPTNMAKNQLSSHITQLLTADFIGSKLVGNIGSDH